eukprot:7036911-Prymnesium_polylepis.1
MPHNGSHAECSLSSPRPRPHRAVRVQHCARDTPRHVPPQQHHAADARCHAPYKPLHALRTCARPLQHWQPFVPASPASPFRARPADR